MAICIAVGGSVAGAGTVAADVPWPAKARFQYVAQKKDLRELLREFSLSQGVTVSVAEGVEGSVSGKFDLKPQAMLDLLASSHGFIWYYDGSLLHVMPSSNVRTEVIQLRYGSMEQLNATLNRLGILDRRYPLNDDGDGSVVVSGPARYVELVQQVADNLEGSKSRNQATEVRVYPLNFAWAADHEFTSNGQSVIISGVASVLRSMYQSNSRQHKTGPASINLPMKVQPPKNLRMSTDTSPGAQYTATTKSGEMQKNGGSDPADDFPVIQADPHTNSVLIRDIPSRMKQYESLIRTLDIRPTMIEIEARIIEVSSEDAAQLGVDWRLNSQPTANAGNSLSRLNDVRNFNTAGVLKTVLANAGLNLVERVSALASQGRANVTASPSVLTLNNLEARMDNTETFFVRVAGLQNAELFNVSTGVTLRVTPMIVGNARQRRIKLDVRIEDGRIDDRTVDQIPVVKRSEISTQAFVNDGDALLIAGYALEQESKGEAKVPGLSSIPIVGGLFRNVEASKKKMQRLFLLTPRIVEEEGHPGKEQSALEPIRQEPVAHKPAPVKSIAPAKPAIGSAPPTQALPAIASSAPAPAPATAPVSTWDMLPSDRTVRGVMTRWAGTAGWDLLWELPVDYEVEKHTSLPGTFEDAVAAVSRSVEKAEVSMKVIFYKTNKVLRIVAKEAQ